MPEERVHNLVTSSFTLDGDIGHDVSCVSAKRNLLHNVGCREQFIKLLLVPVIYLIEDRLTCSWRRVNSQLEDYDTKKLAIRRRFGVKK